MVILRREPEGGNRAGVPGVASLFVRDQVLDSKMVALDPDCPCLGNRVVDDYTTVRGDYRAGLRGSAC